MSVVDFVTGNHQNVLAAGRIDAIDYLPASALTRRSSFRRFTLTHLGRSEVLLIGTRGPRGEFLLTITAATLRPVQLRFDTYRRPRNCTSAIDDAGRPRASTSTTCTGRPPTST